MGKTFKLDQWKADRQRARTDLLFLCNFVLQYADVNEEVHGPIVNTLQKFQGGTDDVTPEGRLTGYTPAVSCWEMERTSSKRLYLDPRGHLKTTVITIAHSIQWIINYPDIRLIISTATGELGERVPKEIRAHFQYNEMFRFLFPDFCPPANSVGEFGNSHEFTVPNRQRKWMKEPTMAYCSVGKVIAGGHYEVVKCCDMVDKENVKTANQIQEVKEHFKYLQPLLETGGTPPRKGWLDVEGTPYDFGDMYQDIRDQAAREEAKGKSSWFVSVRDAYRKYPTETLWPQRFSPEVLADTESEMGPEMFHAQYRMNPVPPGSSLASKEDIIWMPASVIRNLNLRLHCTVDLHGMDPNAKGKDNDYSCINVAGFDRDGRLYVIDVRHGRFETHEVIEHLFDVNRKYKLFDIKIEKEAHARVLLPFLQREMAKRFTWLPIVAIPRDNQTSKQHRIKGLQPWFRNHTIRFSEDLACRGQIINEVTRFPKYHDDFLDTLADHMQNRDGGTCYDIIPNNPKGDELAPWENKFLGFNTQGQENWAHPISNKAPARHQMTGL